MPLPQFRPTYIAAEADGLQLRFRSRPRGGWTVRYLPAPEAIRVAVRLDGRFEAPSGTLLLLEGRPDTDELIM